jgi:hypothetical protein
MHGPHSSAAAEHARHGDNCAWRPALVYAFAHVARAPGTPPFRHRQEQEECIRETRVLSSLDSDFIIKYYDSFLEKVRT